MHIHNILEIARWLSGANLARFELHEADFQLRLTRPVTTHAPGAFQASDFTPAGVAVPAATPARVAAEAAVCGRFLSRHPLRDEPEVQPGDHIEPGMLVGLIAVGDLYLPVIATEKGTLGRFMVDDHQLVGYGTPLVSLAADR